MKKSIKILVISLSVIFCVSCRDTIFVDIPETEPRIVIEGQLINKPSSIQNFVRLSYSSKNSSTANIKPINGALVYIEDNNGTRDTLKEVSPYEGSYINTTVKAELTKSYKLHVEIDGKVYESNVEKMAPQAPIDTAWGQEVKTYPLKDLIPPIDSTHFIQVGYKKTSSTTSYSRWQLQREKQWDKNVFTNKFIIGDDELVNVGPIEDRPFFVDSFNKGTKVNVERYSLNRDAYDYWLGLETQLDGGGSPFDTPPAPLFTNLRNVNDEKEQVLGYFTISQLDEYIVEIK